MSSFVTHDPFRIVGERAGLIAYDSDKNYASVVFERMDSRRDCVVFAMRYNGTYREIARCDANGSCAADFKLIVQGPRVTALYRIEEVAWRDMGTAWCAPGKVYTPGVMAFGGDVRGTATMDRVSIV
ncbi:MAG: hypothetical protein CMK92_03370 [Pseudomonas sp.]|nr:hypothetical protein [Pseudomonas sp.]